MSEARLISSAAWIGEGPEDQTGTVAGPASHSSPRAERGWTASHSLPSLPLKNTQAQALLIKLSLGFDKLGLPGEILFCRVAVKGSSLPVSFGLGISGLVGKEKTLGLAAAEMGLNLTCNTSILWPQASP